MGGDMAAITPLPITHILVPLDGSRLAESALGPAIVLGGQLGARVVRHGGAPALMIRQETAGDTAPFAPRTVLVALDGTEEGEVALPPALTLAQAFGATLHLLVVVATLATIGGDRAAAARLIPSA